MPLINLTHYMEASAGVWTDPAQYDPFSGFSAADSMAAERLMLRWPGDFVKLHGPLSIRVTVQAENMTFPSAFSAYFDAGNGLDGGGNAGVVDGVSLLSRRNKAGYAQYVHASTIYTYTLDIPAGQFWPFALAELVNAPLVRLDQIGNNLAYRILIEPAQSAAKLAPVVSCADLPCDYAVADQADTARFFPAACEPCGSGAVGLPPGGTLPFVTPAADGGCVRTRFFNGMFITSEDLETEQRYHRLKSRLHNRAAGAGVVWGLNVGKRGEQVWVMPGYGIDCCGNDLTVTATYKVDVAMLLATLGGWLTQMLRREAAGTAHEITTPRREIAEGIYHLAWVLLFGVSGRADSAELGGALKRLLEAWCEELLWKGPQCHGGPHGVVIGCAQLEGGTIQRVDPFGGRRHVVHYPLITHWAAQFGIAPPDISIARFFSHLCCVAGLAAPSAEATEALAFIGEFGSGFLAVGEPGQVMRKIAGTHTQIIAQRKVGMAEMIFSAIKLLRDRAPVETKKYSALVLEDFVAVGTVMLLQPETSVVFKPE